jgi:hypothetical protein
MSHHYETYGPNNPYDQYRNDNRYTPYEGVTPIEEVVPSQPWVYNPAYTRPGRMPVITEQQSPGRSVIIKEGYTENVSSDKLSCQVVDDHVKNCRVCSKLYKTNHMIYIIIIILLLLIVLLLVIKICKEL